MKSGIIEYKYSSKNSIKPMKVEQALVGLKMDQMDVPLLQYFNFFTKSVPVEAAYFLHVSPEIEWTKAVFEKEGMDAGEVIEIGDCNSKLLRTEIRTHLYDVPKMDFACEVRRGNRLEEMLNDSEELYADLILLGKRKGDKSQSVFVKNLIRKIKCNALVVPEKAKHTLKKILVPIDFSKYSIKALRRAVGIAKQLIEPAQVVCLNVYEMPDLASFKLSRNREQFKQMIKRDRMEGLEAFVCLHAQGEKDRIQKVLIEKETPSASQYILEYANNNEVDFIVMGAKGHSKIELLLMGSVTEKLLTLNNSIPTMVVKK